MDTSYLDNAVYRMEAFLEPTEDPYYGGEVGPGARAEHCWNGEPKNPNHLTRLRYGTFYQQQIPERSEATAPVAADVASWRY